MPLFEDHTPELIRDRVLTRMETVLQTREGSFSYDMVSPVAFEIWRVLMTLDELITAFYVDENSGGYLDAHANLLALARRHGTKAAAVIHFTGRDGITIPAGTAFFTAAGLEFGLLYDVTLAGGEGTGYIQAGQVGAWYNIEAGEISQILRNISGLESYRNEEAVGGTDPESDASLFERIDHKRKNPSTSGNENHYKEWALSCEGVGGAKVTGLWNGPGTVRVLIIGYDCEPLDNAVVAACYDYIQTQRPVGAEVTVMSAAASPVDIAATVRIRQDASEETVKAMLKEALGEYLNALAEEYFKQSNTFRYPVYYNKVAAILMGVDGVIDFTSLTVNGGIETIEIDATAAPVLGEVTLLCES